jgi:tetratricopeptide (TPR) repeat protein
MPASADDRETCTKAAGDESIAACTRAIATGQGNLAWAYANRCLASARKQDHDRAIADCDQAIKLDPRYARAYNNRAVAYFHKGDKDRAIADYDQAIKLDPKDARTYNNRGITYRDKGDNDRAIADFDQAIRLDPAFTMAYTSRGLAYERKGDRDRARSDFRAALALPQNYYTGKLAHDTSRERLAALDAVQPPAAAGHRVALVIGNSAYATLPAIPNPRNDAGDVADSLRTLGFDVLLGQDLKRADMEDLLIRFARKIDKADTALVFYAGHGLQHNGINYLVPVDARIEDEADLRKLFNLAQVIDDLQSAARVRILIVDACRDNNVVQQLARRSPATRAAALTRGLARIDGADGTLIAFATQPNRVAADGAGRNSPFTRALLKHMVTPGLELRTLMTRVRAEVVSTTDGAQRPEVWDSLVGEFAFKAGP